MAQSEVLRNDWKEMIHGMEMEIHAQTELINVQRGQIKLLEEFQEMFSGLSEKNNSRIQNRIHTIIKSEAERDRWHNKWKN